MSKQIKCVPSGPGSTTYTVMVEGKTVGEIEHLGDSQWVAYSYGQDHSAENQTYTNKRMAAQALAYREVDHEAE